MDTERATLYQNVAKLEYERAMYAREMATTDIHMLVSFRDSWLRVYMEAALWAAYYARQARIEMGIEE